MNKDLDKNLEIKNINNIESLSLFKDDANFVFIHKKTEKLLTALYMLTSFMDEKDPMRWKFRSLGMKLLSVNITLKDSFSSKKITSENEMKGIILELTSLLNVAKFSGLVSEMNYSVLVSEFGKILSILEDNSSNKENGNQFSVASLLFNDIAKNETKNNTEQTKEYEEVDYHKETINKQEDKEINKGQNTSVQKTEYLTPRISNQKPEKKLKDFSTVAIKKNTRKSIIINILKRKKEVMIKDITPMIQNCSEKTIQRELQTMVKEGVLKREGEKRWSRYSLV